MTIVEIFMVMNFMEIFENHLTISKMNLPEENGKLRKRNA